MITVPLTDDLVRGAAELERTDRGLRPHRLPEAARARSGGDPQLAMVEAQTSGVRIAFRTTADRVELDTRPTRRIYPGAPERPPGVYDLVVSGRLVEQASVAAGDTLVVDLATGATEHCAGEAGTLRFHLGRADAARDVEIWLPHNEETVLVALRSSAPLEPLPSAGRRTWVHHGSSISHGSNAASPTTTWPAVAARVAGVDLVNLGLGGGALLDHFVARTMRDTDADLISLKLGINLVNADLMRRRALVPAVHGFLDTIRDAHPIAPLLVVGPLYCGLHEDTPGPAEIDPASLATGTLRFRATGDPADVAAGRLTLRVVREVLAEVVSQRGESDPHLFLLDGLELYGEADSRQLPLPDGLHPDAETHRQIGERFAAAAFGDGGPFAALG